MRKSSILLILVLIGVVSTAAAAPTDGYIATITIDGTKNVTFADHTDSMLDGNWIELSGGTSVELPDPIRFTYNGINESTYTYNGITVDVALNVDKYSDQVISYPYTTHQMYTDVQGQNNVNMTFRGSTYFADKAVDVYLLSPSRASLTDAFSEVIEGNTTPITEMLDGAYQKHLNQPLNSSGDMNLDFGNLGARDYAVLVLLNDTYLEGADDISILSATAFEVLEYDSILEAPEIVSPGEDIKINMSLVDAPASSYTYGALLINEDAYKAEMNLNFNGTKDGTNFTFNDVLLIEGFNLVGLDIYNPNVNDALDTLVNIAGGPNNVTMVLPTTKAEISTNMTLTTLDLDEGNYILLVGVYESGNYLAAFQQTTVMISAAPVEPTCTLEGTVVTNPSGTPIENVIISIDGVQKAITDSYGDYEIESIPYGTYEVSASKPNYITNSTILNIDSLYEIFDFILTPTKATITGTVVDENGNPIPGAMVKIFAKPTMIVETSSDTNSLGKFTAYVPADEGGSTYEIMVSAPRYASTDKIEETVYPGNSKTISSDNLTLRNNKAEMKLAKGEKLKFAEANENATFSLKITNHGNPAVFDISYSGDTTIYMDKSQVELEGSGNESIVVVNVTSDKPGTYPVTIKAENTTEGKSSSFEIVAVIKNSTIVYRDDSAYVDTNNTTVTNGSVILGNSKINQKATVKNGSVVDSEISGSAAEVNNSVVMKGAVVNNSKILEGSVVSSSTIKNATVTEGSSVENSDIGDGSQLNNATATNTKATKTKVKNATLKNVVASNSKVEGVELSNVTIENATVVSKDGEPVIVNGSITTEEKIKFVDVYIPKNVKQLVIGHEPNNNASKGKSKIDKRDKLGVYLTQNSTKSGNVSLTMCSISTEGKPNVPKNSEIVGNILTIESDIPNENITRTEIQIYLDDPSIKDDFDTLTIRYQDPSTGDLTELEDCTTGYDEEIGKWYVSGYTTHYSTFMIVGENNTDNTSSSSGGSSSGGSGGGGASSGEDYDNIELKDVSKVYINKDSVASFTFTNPQADIQYISYTPLTNAGFITTTIEQLKDISNFVDGAPEGIVSKYVNIWVGKAGYATENNIKEPVIGFRVSKAWVEENNIDMDSIKLNRYHGDVWNALPTTLSDEDEQYLYFESATPGFSPFAVTGEEKAEPVAEEDMKDTETDTQPGTETKEPGEEPESSLGKYVGGFVALLAIAGAMLGYIRTRRYN